MGYNVYIFVSVLILFVHVFIKGLFDYTLESTLFTALFLVFGLPVVHNVVWSKMEQKKESKCECENCKCDEEN